MDVALAQALLAGWVSGAAAGLLTTALALVVAVRRPALAARLPMQRRLPVLGIVLANALIFALTLVGLVLGALYDRSGASAGATGFVAAVVGSLAALGALYAFVRGGVRGAEAPVVLGGLVVSGLAFGVMLPFLAGLDA